MRRLLHDEAKLRSAATSVGRNYSGIETKRPLPLLFDGMQKPQPVCTLRTSAPSCGDALHDLTLARIAGDAFEING